MSGQTRTDPVPSDPRKVGAKGAIGAGLVILVLAALVFSNSYAARQVIDEATVLQRSERVLGATDLALKSLAQAVLLAEDLQLGVADEATVDLALGEARAVLGELGSRVSEVGDVLGGEGSNLTAAASSVDIAGREVVALAESGRVEEAGRLLAGEAKDRLEELRDSTLAIRESTSSTLTSAGQVVGTVANIARFLAVFLLPAAVILAYRVMARRQLRVAEIQLDARLEAEHEVIRAKDEFIANISHELRTPLTSIYGFSELLLEQGLIDPEAALDLIGVINTESSDLARMVEDLLVSARADAGALVYKSTAVAVVPELEAVLAPLVRAGDTVGVDCPSVEVWADSLRLRQIIRNLISNAQRHGGPDIRVYGEVEGDHFVCTVADSGPGVSFDMERRLFTRFVHEGEDPLTVGSVGLGLAVVKSLAEGMNGDVRYERVDGWTHFVFSLPLAHAPVLEEPAGDGRAVLVDSVPVGNSKRDP